jgi:hypothetical protein
MPTIDDLQFDLKCVKLSINLQIQDLLKKYPGLFIIGEIKNDNTNGTLQVDLKATIE